MTFPLHDANLHHVVPTAVLHFVYDIGEFPLDTTKSLTTVKAGGPASVGCEY